MHPPDSLRPRRCLSRFAALTFAPFLLIVGQNLLQARILGPSAVPFLLVVWLEYTVLYLAAAFLLPWWLTFCGDQAARASGGVAVATTSLLGFFLFVDATIFRMYGFHWNSFVWNLLTTRGGIESMDGGAATWVEGAVVFVAMLLLQLLLARLARSESAWWRRLRPARPRRAAVLAGLLFVLLAAGERLAFAISNFTGHRPVTVSQDVFPFYLRTRARQLAQAMGLDAREDIGLTDVRGTLEPRYPLAPLARDPAAPALNIVWLVAESWRADTLVPELMPDTVKFAQRAHWFRHHYSGGNCTRMGVFSMFYGLYGSYWFPFRSARRGPVLVDLLLDGGWQMFVSTSARFTFPEFDETVWSRLPFELLIEGDEKKYGWENDRLLTDRMLQRIDERDPARPFFAFHFFESPHARYHFPKECAIRTPYCDVVDYALLGKDDMPAVKNRYLNSVHHLDTQLAKVIAGLEARGLLATTVIVVTGDHGEEFMEKGRYGHHSAFSEEQTRVPLLLWVPGSTPRSCEELSSHHDLPATVLARLGVTSPPNDYSLGIDLLGTERRDHVVMADWDHLCLRDGAGKGAFELAESGGFDWEGTTVDDAPLADREAWLRAAGAELTNLAKSQRRFTR